MKCFYFEMHSRRLMTKVSGQTDWTGCCTCTLYASVPVEPTGGTLVTKDFQLWLMTLTLYLPAWNQYFSCKTWHLHTPSAAKQQTSCQHRSAWQCVSVKAFKSNKSLTRPPFHHYACTEYSVLHTIWDLASLKVKLCGQSEAIKLKPWSQWWNVNLIYEDIQTCVSISLHEGVWLAAASICYQVAEQRETQQAITIRRRSLVTYYRSRLSNPVYIQLRILWLLPSAAHVGYIFGRLSPAWSSISQHICKKKIIIIIIIKRQYITTSSCVL